MDRNRFATTVLPAQNLSALLALDYEQFVECAYLTILNRTADEDGLMHFVERLKVGHPKIAILSAMYGSPEARSANVRIPWMQGAIRRYKLTRLPIIRLFFNRVNHNAIMLQFEHRIHTLEQKVAALANQHDARVPEQGGPGSTAVQAASDLPPAAFPEGLISGKSPVAKRVYHALVEAISQEREDPRRPP